MSDRPVITDREVAKMMGVPLRTFQDRVAHPRAGDLDITRHAQPYTFANRRYWHRDEIEKMLHAERNTEMITATELLAVLRKLAENNLHPDWRKLPNGKLARFTDWRKLAGNN